MASVEAAAKEHEQDERQIEKESWQEVREQFWSFANSLIQLVPLFRKGLTKKGFSPVHYCCNGLVIVVIVYCAVIIVLVFSAGLEGVGSRVPRARPGKAAQRWGFTVKPRRP